MVYMGAEDIQRQSPNVFRMKLLGATVVPVESGSKTLKDALNEAMRDWVTNVENTFYIIGTVAGPHPYPMMVRDFQSVIGNEAMAQIRKWPGASRMRCRLRGRRLQRDGHVLSLHRLQGAAGRCRSGGHGIASGQHAAPLTAAASRRAARQQDLSDAGRRRPDHRDAFGVGRAGLSRRRSRACLVEGQRPRANMSRSTTTRR